MRDLIRCYMEQGSDSWFDEKLGRITGSRFNDCMMGENTKGYNELIGRIAGEILTGEFEESVKTSSMQDGNDREPEAREHLSEIIGEISEIGFMYPDTGEYFDDYVGLSPDGIIEEKDAYVEIKCPMLKTHMGYFRENKLPKEYKWQLQGGLWVTKADHAYFCSYYPDTKPFIIKIEPNEDDQKKIDERIKITVDRVKTLIENYKKSGSLNLSF